MSDLSFQKLTPTSNVDLNVYEEGFEFIFRIKRTTGTNYNGYWAMGIVAFIAALCLYDFCMEYELSKLLLPFISDSYRRETLYQKYMTEEDRKRYQERKEWLKEQL